MSAPVSPESQARRLPPTGEPFNKAPNHNRGASAVVVEVDVNGANGNGRSRETNSTEAASQAAAQRRFECCDRFSNCVGRNSDSLNQWCKMESRWSKCAVISVFLVVASAVVTIGIVLAKKNS
jgi:hypothetical protein